MKIGIPILTELDSVEQHIELARRLGFDFVELNLGFPCCMPDRINFSSVKNCKDIFFTVHLPETIEVGEICENARQRQVDYAKYLMKLYNEKGGITKFNLHLDLGIVMTLPDNQIYIFEKYKSDYLNSIRKSFSELSEFAGCSGISLCFENLAKTKPFVIEALAEIPRYPNLFFTFDTGHDAMTGNTARSLFMQNPQKIQHMHLHDFNGKTDHQELGTGFTDFKKYVEFAGKNNLTVLIEVRKEPELANSIKLIKQYKPGC